MTLKRNFSISSVFSVSDEGQSLFLACSECFLAARWNPKIAQMLPPFLHLQLSVACDTFMDCMVTG